MGGKPVSESLGGRVDIVPQGELHFEVRFFEGENDKRYRSWCLPVAAGESITRWWLRRSLPLGEVPLDSEESARLEVRADETCSISLKRVAGKSDILELHRGTPIADWLRYHNLWEGPHSYEAPKLLIVTCMDYRIHLHVPERFAYVLRLAGANLRHREFDLACVLAFAGIRHVCLVGHTDCAMESLKDKREVFASGLQRVGGWSKSRAELQFDLFAPRLAIPNVVDFTLFEAAWLGRQFPRVVIAPLIYDVKDGSLHQIVGQP